MSIADLAEVTEIPERAGNELVADAEDEAILVLVGPEYDSPIDAVSDTPQGVNYGRNITVFRVGDGYIVRETNEVDFTAYYVVASDFLPTVVQSVLDEVSPKGTFQFLEVDDDVWWYDEIESLSG